MKQVFTRLCLAALCAGWVGAASAAVDVDTLLQESAMWLDASSLDNFVFNESGGVTNWVNRSTTGRATYGDASAYALLNNLVHYGAVAFNRGVPTYQMYATNEGVDLQYTRVTGIRAVFIVGEFVINSALAPILGDSKSSHFHRNSNGAYWNQGWSDDGDGLSFTPTFYQNSATVTCDGQTTFPSTNRFDILTVTADKGLSSNCLSSDRLISGRSAGRSLSEVLIFTRELSDEERTAVYDYLDAKWNHGGWNAKGTWELFTNRGGPALSFDADVTLGTADAAAAVIPTNALYVASGATATFKGPMLDGGLAVLGGGSLNFEGGFRFTGEWTQQGGTLDLGGGSMDFLANPNISSNTVWRNGTFLLNYWNEFRPVAGTTLTLGSGAVVKKNCYWRTMIDRGDVTLNLEEGSFMDVPGPLCVTIDNGTENWLNIAGGTLVVTNTVADASSSSHNQAVTILSQPAVTGGSAETKKGHFTMTSGRLVAGKLRVASGWNSTGGGNIVGTAEAVVTGGTIDLLDRIEIGTTSATHGTSTTTLNACDITAPNGLIIFGNGDECNTLTLDGTVFHATADCSSYFTMSGDTGSGVSLGANGLTLDVAADKTVSLGFGFQGTGALVKKGAGTLALDKAAAFTGGVTVEAGTLALKQVDGLGVGGVWLKNGATLDVGRCRPVSSTIAATSKGTLRVTISEPGVNTIIGVETGFDTSSLVLDARDGAGNVLADAEIGLSNGKLTVTVPDIYKATLDSTTADWYALPWTLADVAKDYPKTAGATVGAQLTANGTSTIALSEQVYAGTLTVINGSETAANVKLTGAGSLAGSVDLRNFNGDFATQMEIPYGLTLGANTTYSLDADENTEWALANPLVLDQTAGGSVRKTGLGTVVYPGFPAMPIDVQAGSLALTIDTNLSVAPTNLTSSTGAGCIEKRGEGQLTITGGTWSGSFHAMEGLTYINGPFQGITATAQNPFYVGPKGSVYIYGNQTNNRLPNQPVVYVDGGTFTLSGTNPTQYQMSLTVTNHATFVCDNTRGAEHLKFISLDICDSTFRFTGTKNAYQYNGCYINAPALINVMGECTFDKDPLNPNKLAAGQAVTLTVASDAKLNMGMPIIAAVNMAGGGTVQFMDGMTNSTARFTVNNGTVLNGGACPQLGFAAGTTFKAVDGAPLRVTTLTMPDSGTVTLDLSGIDFSTRETELFLLDCPSLTAAQTAKFSVVGMPDAPWKMSTTGGIRIKKATQPQTLTWNSGDGQWTATAWNNDPEGYGMDGYHTVMFQNSTNENPSATTTVTVTEDRVVAGCMVTANTTPYVVAGAGQISTPSFSATGMAGFAFTAPVYLTTGGITFAATTADQYLLVRGTTGTITVPAAKSGNVVLDIDEACQRSIGGLSLGAGKTLELRNDTTTTKSLNFSTAPVTAAGSTLKFTGPKMKGACHEDLTVNSTEFRGRLEVADGGWLYLAASLANATATEAEPIWVHGAGSVLSTYGSQTANYPRIPNNGWVRVDDSARFQVTGVNSWGQQTAPNVVCSNATIYVQDDNSTHLHLHEIYLEDGGNLQLGGTGTAWSQQGLVLWGNVHVRAGDGWMTQVSGNNNWLYFSQVGGTSDINGTVEVAQDATLHVGPKFHKSITKTGEGMLVFESGVVMGTERSLNLEAGWLKVNDLASSTNVIDTLTIGTKVGLDLTTDASCFGTAEAAPVISGTGVVTLKTGSRALEVGEYLVRWTDGNAPSCSFKLSADETVTSRLKVQRVADGIVVTRRDFAIFFR